MFPTVCPVFLHRPPPYPPDVPARANHGPPPLELPYAVIKADSLSTMREGIPPEHA